MSNDAFILDARLAADCHLIGSFRKSHVLLLNNALIPWLILVPETQLTELHELPNDQQKQTQEEINLLSVFTKAYFQADKLNTAAIGNIVSQLHIHVVARKKSDCRWPGVVWGMEEKQAYDMAQVITIREALAKHLSANHFTPNQSL